MPGEPADRQSGSARSPQSEGEHRWPPALAVVAAIVVYGLLPESLLVGPRLLIPSIEAVLLIALLATNPVRMTRQSSWSRVASMALSILVIATNLAALVLLVTQLGSQAGGMPMLIGAMQVWLTNVIGFALLFWELDRAGPVARRRLPRDRMPLADWRFSQDENAQTVSEVERGSSESCGWTPTFIDYLYMSLTNSSAFSPTDTMPLSGRAKALMGVEATAALLTSLLVVARAVGSLGG